MKHPLVRASVLLTFSCLVLYCLHATNVLDTTRVRVALRENPTPVLLSALCIVASSFIGVVRHQWALRVLEVRTPWPRVLSANLIGQPIGQWFGSMAISEVVRVGLLLGSTAPSEREGRIGRVAMASLVDRVLGIAVMFLVGSVAAVIAASRTDTEHRQPLLMISGLTLTVGLALMALPLGANTRVFAWLFEQARRIENLRLVGGLARKINGAVGQLQLAAARWNEQPSAMAVTVCLAVVVSVLTPLTFYLASIAINDTVPFMVLMALYPTTIVGVVLPIGFAGLGAPQLVTAALFAPFGVSVETVLAMTLLQAALVLIVQTALGLIWAGAQGRGVIQLIRKATKAMPPASER